MKKIFLFSVIAGAVAALLFVSKNEEQKPLRVTVLSNLKPLPDVYGAKNNWPGTENIMWIEDEKQESKHLSFCADESTLKLLVEKLNDKTVAESNKDKYGFNKNYTWYTETINNRVLLKRVHTIYIERSGNC